MNIRGLVQLKGFKSISVEVKNGSVNIGAQSCGKSGICPDCKHTSTAMHSRYHRKAKDLPITGQKVVLVLELRRYYCRNSDCLRKTFVEDCSAVVAPRVRQTMRFRSWSTIIGMVLGGRGGTRLAHNLAMPVSADTILRLVKSSVFPSNPSVSIIGVDDWAWRKRIRYGTIIVDLEQQRPIDLLPDRSAEALATWLAAHPAIRIVTRDRSPEYRRGIDRGAPQAQQVADRWHLLHNLREALERASLRLKPTVERVLGEAGFAHQLEPRHGKEAQQRDLKRQARQRLYQDIQTRHRAGASISQIARDLNMSYGGVRHFVTAPSFPEQAPRRHVPSQLEPYTLRLQALWDAGCHVAMELWRTIWSEGFTGGPRQVHKWVQRRRVEVHPFTPKRFREAVTRRIQSRPKHALPSPSTLAWLCMQDQTRLTSDEQTILGLLQADRTLKQLYDMAQQFVELVRARRSESLATWLEAVPQTPFQDLHTFALGLGSDLAAVTAAVTLPYSNGPVEGHINRLKMLKRQMYGRAGFTLLRARVLYAG